MSVHLIISNEKGASVKLKINRDRLADIVTRGVSSAPKNSPSVIANNARIIARDGVLSIASTDFDMMVEASGECEMEHRGTTTVDAAKLKMTVDRLPKGVEVSFAYDDAKRDLIVKAGRSRVTFPTLAAEDWPARESKVSGAKFQLSGADLVRLFGHTSQALSNVPNSPMAGVFLHVREGDGRPVLAAVGTTGMILILATVDLPEGAENMPHREGHPAGVILSSETVNAVLRLFRAADVVDIEVDSSTILFTTDDVQFSWRSWSAPTRTTGRWLPTRPRTACSLTACRAQHRLAARTVRLEGIGPPLAVRGFGRRLRGGGR